MSSMPISWKEDVFQHLKEIGLKANMSPTEKMRYDLAWVQYWGIVEAHADELRQERSKGKAEGRAEGILETARNLKTIGISYLDISKATGLSFDEIEKL